MKQNPWTVKASKTVYYNPWITVTEDSVIQPDGKEGTHAKIVMKDGVTVLPLDSDNNVYLAKEFKYAVSHETLEAISGGFESGEDPLSAAKRELLEETGVTAKNWIYMGVVDPFTTVISSRNHMYLAKDLTFGNHHQEGTETIEIVKMPLTEAVEKVGNEITHGASCVVLLKAFNNLHK